MKKEFINGDCLEYLKNYPAGFFDLAIVDPPYGDAKDGNPERFGQRFDRYKTGGGINRTGGGWASKYKQKIIDWDVAPRAEYFQELFRVSKKAIIWGGNYFKLEPQRNFIIWRKTNIPQSFTMAACEYAWTNIPGNAKIFDYPSTRDDTSGKFHPTEKPIALYKWLLQNYAAPGDIILDTHVGSASSLIACEDMGFNYVGFEIDPEYYKKARERLEDFNAQLRFSF